jgi:hypothetical protein
MQTSIEWFIEHLLGNGLLRLTKEDHNLYSKLRDKAKEIHKQEIMEAFKHGELPPIFVNLNAEQYYQETYKK